MCKSTDIHHAFNFTPDRDRIKFNALYVNFSLLKSCSTRLPDSLTLIYLPRINNNTSLEINGFKIRPDSPTFVTLYRIGFGQENGINGSEIVFASRDRVVASETVRMEIFWREEKVLKGIFRKDENQNWKLECCCEMERTILGVDVAAAEINLSVVGVGEENGKEHVAISERVEMVAKRKKMRSFERLDEIPEEREIENDGDDEEMDGCDGCCCSRGEGEDLSGLDGEDCEVGVEGVRWAVDVGIWVMSLGLGFLVTKASYKSLRLGKYL